MRSVWLVLLALGFVVAPLLALAQTQPSQAPVADGYTVREELASAGSLDGALRVLRFVQVSDAHILDDDAPYPLRQEPLDPFITVFSTAAQRPQDEYTDEVLESIVRAINQADAADAVQFVINTGDNIDNDLENELMRFLDLWDGTSTTTGPISGLECAPDGQSTDVADASHDVTDQCTSLPESLLANRTALAARIPWLSAFGNHDTLIQGNVNPNEQFEQVAAQYGRHLLTQPEYVAMHFADGQSCGGGSPVDDEGHGYGRAGDRLCDTDPDNDGYYSLDVAGLHLVVLDTLNDDFATANGFGPGVPTTQSIAGADIIGGYAEGAIDPVQLEWLRQEIANNQDKLVLVFSHHTVNSMFTNLADGYCAPGLGCLADALDAAGYGTGEGLTAELAQQPNVVAWFGGHTHRHRIEPKGAEAPGGFWNVESSSLIDYPQEARVVELWVTADGAKGFLRLTGFGHDYQLSKDLEATDPQRAESGAGDADDQDTILWFDVPAGVALSPQPMLERRLTLRIVQDAPAEPGEPTTVRVRITDNATGEGVPGLSAAMRVVRSAVCTDKPGAGEIVVAEGVNLTDDGDGNYSTSVVPGAAITHYLTVTVQAAGPYDGKAQVLSLNVAGDLPTCKSKGSPSPGLAVVAVDVFAVALLGRRHW